MEYDNTDISVVLEMLDKSISEKFTDSFGRPFVSVIEPNGVTRLCVHSPRFAAIIRAKSISNLEKRLTPYQVRNIQQQLVDDALLSGLTNELHLRVAGNIDNIYIDLSNIYNEVIEIDSEGIRIGTNEDVYFLRPDEQHSLIRPDFKGTFDDIQDLFRLSKRNLVLLRAWAMYALTPVGPHPILVLSGQQGSGKSTLCRMLQRLIDPHRAGLRSVPKTESDFMIAAQSSWLLVFDNLTYISQGQSDLISLAVTGGTLGKRILYTDDQELILSAKRPMVLNGINEMVRNSDLADRCIFVELEPIPEAARRTEAELMDEFLMMSSQLLGGLVKLIQKAIVNYPNTPISGYPRMADFARFVFASEGKKDLKDSLFIQAYNDSRSMACRLILEGNPVSELLLRVIPPGNRWEGSASDLLRLLGNERMRQTTALSLPRTPTKLSQELRRLVPNLREVGVIVDFTRTPAERLIAIQRIPIRIDESK